jgi:prepilin-type N-terminal cleavage/methylation domain-containing protein/prepilin-type processing-associated H-X9-DG protein
MNRARRGFTLTELLVVVAVIALLAALLIPALSRSRDTAYRIACLHHVGQIQLAGAMYALDNSGFLPPHEPQPGSKWPSQLQNTLKDPNILLCPVDSLDTSSSPTNHLAAFDTQPRSYVMNGFYDFFANRLEPSDMAMLTKGLSFAAMNEADISDPGNTILFGEKSSTNNIYYLNVLENGGMFLPDLDENRHGLGKSGGANYGMADGSVTFLKFAADTSPLNMWGITDTSRTSSVVCRPR